VIVVAIYHEKEGKDQKGKNKTAFADGMII
jgi:hypothetical protein